MLGDVELFIVSWTIWLSSFALIVLQELLILRGVKRRFKDQEVIRQPKARPSSIAFLIVFILLCIIGMVVDLLNQIPVTEYNDETWLFRSASISFGVFAVTLFMGIVFILVHRQIPVAIKEMDKTKSK